MRRVAICRVAFFAEGVMREAQDDGRKKLLGQAQQSQPLVRQNKKTRQALLSALAAKSVRDAKQKQTEGVNSPFTNYARKAVILARRVRV
jgi:hypothetical protein